MKILHLNSNYNTSTIYKQLYSSLEKNDVTQYVYIPVKKDFKLFKETLKVENDTKNTTHYFRKIITNLENKLFFPKIYKMYQNVKKEISMKEIDLIHAHSTFSNGFVAYLLKKKFNIKYIVAFRSTDYKVFNSCFLFRIILKKIMLESEKIVFINYPYKNKVIDDYFKYFKEKIEIIPNGVDNYWINNKVLDKKNNNNKIKFITIGYFIERKNFEYVINLINQISDEYDTELTIIGEGPLEDKLNSLISNKKNMKLLPWMPKEELKNLLRENDIFILPSSNETFGLVYLEALSQGLSIIYKKDDGIDGYIDEKFGFGCTLDLEKDKKSLKDFLKNKKDNYKFDINKFSWNEIAKIYCQLYFNIINFNN